MSTKRLNHGPAGTFSNYKIQSELRDVFGIDGNFLRQETDHH